MGEGSGNFIDGKWADSAGGATFEDLNPANKADSLGSYPRSDHRDADRAVETARACFALWRQTPPRRRADILFRAAALLAERREETARLITRETGKVIKESEEEVQEAIDILHVLGGQGHRLTGEAMALDAPGSLALHFRAPLGVVAAITPWTLPLAVPIAHVASALVVGNTLVFKPSKDSPAVAAHAVRLLLDAGLPPAALQLVHGVGEEAGAPLVRHPDVSLVSFIGSAEDGREVAIACAAEHKRVALEVRGKSALLVLEDADIDLAVRGAIRSAFRTSGQSPASTSRLLVHRKAAKEFVDRLVKEVQSLQFGDGQQPGMDLGPMINEAQLKRVHTCARVAVKEGAKLAWGGEISREGDHRKGFFYPPTVFLDVHAKMRLAQEDAPGPILGVILVGSLEEALDIAVRTRTNRRVAIYTRDLPRALAIADRLTASAVCLNRPTTGESERGQVPAAGQESRACEESEVRPLDTFTRWRAVYLDSWDRPR